MPAWTHAQLKAAYIALGSPADLGAAATTLNAQTVTLSNQPFAWSSGKAIARRAATGDWSRIVARSRQVPALPPATALDAAILAAINAVEAEDGDVIDPTNAAEWGAFQGGISALATEGDISSATIAAITALTSPTVPVWEPPVTGADIQNAKAS